MADHDRGLRCPACDGLMRAVERRGVVIDLCRDCRGVYLDRGELDKLLDHAGAADEPAPLGDQRRAGRNRDDEPWRDERDREWERKRSRRRGWLEELFDFD